MDLRALLAAGDAIAHPHDVDALEPQAVVEAEELARVPRQAGEVLDQDGGRTRAGWRAAAASELLIPGALLDAEAGQGGIADRS